MAEIMHPIQQADDLKPLCELIRPMIGELCWQAKLSYGDQLVLDFGQQRSPDWKAGTWYLESRGTGWRLLAPDDTILAADDSGTRLSNEEHEAVERKLQIVIDSRVADFSVHHPSLALALRFSNQYRLIIEPKAEDNAFDLSYWELMMPNGHLNVGPGLRWSQGT